MATTRRFFMVNFTNKLLKKNYRVQQQPNKHIKSPKVLGVPKMCLKYGHVPYKFFFNF
jgi:hypothetical protein